MLAPDAKTASDYMTINQLVGGWKEAGKFAGAFAGTGASGGGTPAGGSGGRSGGAKKVITPDQIPQYLDEVASGEVTVSAE